MQEQEHKLKSYLETVTSIAVLLVSILIISVFTTSFFVNNPKLQFQSGLQKGYPLTQPQTVIYSHSPRTLLIAVNTKCGYCNASIPFYKQLAESQHDNRTTHIVAVSTEPEDVLKQFLSQNQLDITAVPSVNFSDYNIMGTPTLILVNSNGQILDFWTGKLSQETEQQVLKAVKPSHG